MGNYNNKESKASITTPAKLKLKPTVIDVSNQPPPTYIAIPGGLKVGHCFTVYGAVSDDIPRFAINFQRSNCENSDIAFHFNPRNDEKTVVRNTHIYDYGWQGEEECEVPYFPFNYGEEFKVEIHVTEACYVVYVDSEIYIEYEHRIDLNDMRYVKLTTGAVWHKLIINSADVIPSPIVLCTGNKNKLEEFHQILGPDFPREIEIQDVDLPEYQGEPEEVARAKCAMAVQNVKGPVIVEDNSLCYNALGGMPGPYIKWFLKEMGTQGLHRLLHGFEDKTAYAQCVLAYCPGEGFPIHCFSGKCDGSIVEPRGPTDFGWDPVFQPKGWEQTYAEMDKDEKNKISHRYKATMALKEYLLENM